jgi:hypothetical protein
VPAVLYFDGTDAAIVASLLAVVEVLAEVLVDVDVSLLPQAEMASAAAITAATAKDVRVVVALIKQFPQ